jgi:hypothetical protein
MPKRRAAPFGDDPALDVLADGGQPTIRTRRTFIDPCRMSRIRNSNAGGSAKNGSIEDIPTYLHSVKQHRA